MSGNHVMGEVWASADSRTVALFEVHPRGTTCVLIGADEPEPDPSPGIYSGCFINDEEAHGHWRHIATLTPGELCAAILAAAEAKANAGISADAEHGLGSDILPDDMPCPKCGGQWDRVMVVDGRDTVICADCDASIPEAEYRRANAEISSLSAESMSSYETRPTRITVNKQGE